jgi:DMSO/TMAO reductase YedYZ molybdopterin-dependent catalytic subunit
MTTVQGPPPAAEPPTAPATGARSRRRLFAGAAGVLAAAVALGIGELVAGLVGPASSPVVAVGNAVVESSPRAVKDFAIRTFGENDKVALITGTLVLLALFAVLLGVVGLRSRRAAAAGVLGLGLVGAIASATGRAGGPLDAVPSLVGALVGIVALNQLLAAVPEPAAARDEAPARPDRRRFLVTGGVALGVAAVGGGGGWLLQRRFDVAGARADLVLPDPASPAPRLPPGADLSAEVDGLTRLVTPNREFYRVDIALRVPQIEPQDYRLELRGMFDDARSYTLAELFDRDDLVERDVTLTCVSNEVGGTLAGNARWLGVPLGAFLRENGVRTQSTQLVCRGGDGITIGTPTRAALETEDAMLAFGMNGEPLPVEHGFPLRMIVPGLYGYVSACKWLTSIEATTFERFDAYWVERGWAAQGPIRIASRIDTPAVLRSFRAGMRPIAGVAWAQTRGIARVEVKVDDDDWVEARLSPEVDADVWRQWVLPHDFAPGTHRITVRATDRDGETQTEDEADPFPAGATGWHSVQVLAR